jgi:hypothetical protein
MLSVVWHLFWFFSITIVVANPKNPRNPHPRIVSLGPVLNDAILKTLVQAKPESTPAFYRHISDFPPAVDIPVETSERYQPGDVVSVPLNQQLLNSFRNLIGGKKLSPDNEFLAHLKTGYLEEVYELEGDVKERRILSRPASPEFPPGADDVILDFAVDASGIVSSVDVNTSCGNHEIDEAWKKYLAGWRFSPLVVEREDLIEKGRIHFLANQKKES